MKRQRKAKNSRTTFVPTVDVLEDRLLLDTYSIGPHGINSKTLQLPNGTVLTGDNVSIGQVEHGRPGKSGIDSKKNYNSKVVPKEVSVLDPGTQVKQITASSALKDKFIRSHAIQVAGVIIHEAAGQAQGVAPEADLYSIAFNPIRGQGGRSYQNKAATAFQYLATQDSDNVRAINNSIALGGKADGNNLAALVLDYTAHQNDVLHVVAGAATIADAKDYLTLPSSYNGITIGALDKKGIDYRIVAPFTYTGLGANKRRLIDLSAPGRSIRVALPGDAYSTAGGPSLATPHVTGAVALLQEYAENRIAANANNWDTAAEQAAARSHLTMKAVLMNSADKLKDNGDGNLLGMEKTILKKDGQSTWLQSKAHGSPSIPLDEEMGVGALNVKRALNQFQTGMIWPVPIVLQHWD